jgi:hypothetical protein
LLYQKSHGAFYPEFGTADELQPDPAQVWSSSGKSDPSTEKAKGETPCFKSARLAMIALYPPIFRLCSS